MVLAPVVRLNLEKPRSALALINLKFFGSVLLDLRPNVEIKEPFLKGVKLFSKNVFISLGIPSQYERGMGQSFHFVSSYAFRVTAFGRNP